MSQGHTRLVKVLARLYGELIGRSIDPWREILVSGGAYGALFYTIMSCISQGDEVSSIQSYISSSTLRHPFSDELAVLV